MAPRIVLNMIVKNESAVIGRCLEAALPFVDGYVVCDTGSTDATVALVEEAAARRGVPGQVVRHGWRDFGHNRTQAAAEARAWVAGQGWPLGDAYLLFVDADMVLGARSGFDRAALRAPSYQIAQQNGGLQYYNLRLARLSHEWRSVGVTHEYWEALPGAPPPERLEALWIDDRGDGGSKADKFERDRALLKAELREHPDNERAMFYLAQTQRDLGTQTGDVGALAAARDLYERRAGMGGWEEEVCCAWRQAGRLSAELGEWPRAGAAFLAAWEARPSRLEAVHDLVAGLLDRRQHHTAHRFTALAAGAGGLAVPEDVLFVEPWVYRWGLLFQHSVAAYWCGELDASIRACKRLLAIESLPDVHRHQTEVNMRLAFSQKARQVVERMQMPQYTTRPLAHAGTPTRGRAA